MKTLVEIEKFPKSICPRTGRLDINCELLIPSKIVENKTGFIDFIPYLDPSEIYLSQHNSSIGKIWDLHNDNFAKKIARYEYKNVVELGGGAGNVYKKYKSINKNVKWTLIDLNPTILDDDITIIKDKYNINYINKNDTVISSHFVEHVNDIENFFINLRLKNPKYHIFSIPNFKKYAESKFCSTLMFEHPHFLTEERIEYILQKTQWQILEKNYYRDHSIFFVTVPSNKNIITEKINLNQSHLILDWIYHIKDRCKTIKNIKKFYVFGAHFSYYYFLNFGVKEEQIIAVVDNDKSKCGMRMYGTNTKIIHPTDLAEKSDIVIEMGPYTCEIKENLKNLNYI